MWAFLFLENWQFNQKLCPLFPANILKDSPQNLTKYEIKGIWKISISWKSQNNPEKSPQKIPKHLKNSPQNLTKYEVKGISKLSISLLFSELRIIQNYKELGKMCFLKKKKKNFKTIENFAHPKKESFTFWCFTQAENLWNESTSSTSFHSAMISWWTRN